MHDTRYVLPHRGQVAEKDSPSKTRARPPPKRCSDLVTDRSPLVSAIATGGIGTIGFKLTTAQGGSPRTFPFTQTSFRASSPSSSSEPPSREARHSAPFGNHSQPAGCHGPARKGASPGQGDTLTVAPSHTWFLRILFEI